MSKYQTFYREHQEILKTIEEMEKFLNEASIQNDTQNLVDVSAKLSGQIKIHLAMEDKNLYPKLIASPDENVQKVAKKYQEEMGGIGKVYRKYLDTWDSSDVLKENPQKFIIETNEIFKALKNRIECEEKELYPVAE